MGHLIAAAAHSVEASAHAPLTSDTKTAHIPDVMRFSSCSEAQEMHFWPAGLGVAFALSTVVVAAHAQSSTYTTFGCGADSCGAWLTKQERFGIDEKDWLDGAMSEADALMSERYGINLAANMDIDALFAWVTGYCYNHPLDDVQTATNRLVRELLRRQSRTTAPAR